MYLTNFGIKLKILIQASFFLNQPLKILIQTIKFDFKHPKPNLNYEQISEVGIYKTLISSTQILSLKPSSF